MSVNSQPPLPFFLDQPQYRMSSLQLYNWGTFSGLHRIPIATEGFLLVGRSGSGKSTVLDGLSALLVPPQWLSFNMAAREQQHGRYDRHWVSYVRGAWADQKNDETGEVTTQYLRKGTTWSALAVEYARGDEPSLTLLLLLVLRGNSNRVADVKRHYMIVEGAFDIAKHFDGFDLDLKKFKKRFPEIFITDKFKGYSDRFCSRLGIKSDMALKLLHKTQSAKHLGDLNAFMREYMLEKPDTFAVSDRLVNEFHELDSAHQSVVTLREQIDVLTPARDYYARMETVAEERKAIETLRQLVDGYAEEVKRELFTAAIDKAMQKQSAVEMTLTPLESQLLSHQKQLAHLQESRMEKGGGQIETLSRDIEALTVKRGHCVAKLAQITELCQSLSRDVPKDPEALSALITEGENYLAQYQKNMTDYQQQRDNHRDALREAECTFKQVCLEVKTLREQPSNIPSHMIALRNTLNEALGLSGSDLPFVGELLDVKETEQQWHGAIERLLHGFALSLLVEEKYYSGVVQVVNDSHLSGRLVYYRITPVAKPEAMVEGEGTLLSKLIIKSCPYSDWLKKALTKRFHYQCVPHVDAFKAVERAITPQGQIYHGKGRHEKDDRYSVDDKRRWVLGFDNRDKLAHFEKQAHSLAEKIKTLNEAIATVEQRRASDAKKALSYQSVVNTQWHEIDVSSLSDELTSLRAALVGLREGNKDLKRLSDDIDKVYKAVRDTEEKIATYRATLKNIATQLAMYSEKRDALDKKIQVTTLTEDETAALNKRFSAVGSVNLDNVEEKTRRVEQALYQESEALFEKQLHVTHKVERAFQQFKNRWPQESADQQATIASAPEFMEKLNRLEKDGLPQHEERFYKMLRDQSMENLAALSTHLSQGRKQIMGRLALVNESLSQVSFNPGTYLEIIASDRHLESVKNFRQTVRDILSHAWVEEAEKMENRFQQLRLLIKQLHGQTAEQQRWRQQVLDVRWHVEFIAREYDTAGNPIEVYRSGAGKSGGQREKLATTCLAAALRYQLSDDSGCLPEYAPVVLDEAFAKADNEFTQDVMTIFKNFGFQMIVATPLKSVMTLEPFIGGACYVDIVDRKQSCVFPIAYDEESHALELTEAIDDEALVAQT